MFEKSWIKSCFFSLFGLINLPHSCVFLGTIFKIFSAKKIAQESLKIAAGLCIYTNDSISVIEIT